MEAEEKDWRRWKRKELRGPDGQFFEVQGSKFKPDPGGNPAQTAAVSITHPMLVFGIGENALNSLLAQSVDVFAPLRLTQLLRQIQILLPYVSGQETLALLVGAALLPAGAVPAVLGCAAVEAFSVFIGGSVP